MRHVPIAILGDGIAGLGAALRACDFGQQAVVFDAGGSRRRAVGQLRC